MKNTIYKNIERLQRGIAVLIDPEKSDNGEILLELLKKAQVPGVV